MPSPKPTRPTPRALRLCAALALTLACLGLPVTTQFDPNVDFERLHAYAWLPDPPGLSGELRLHSDVVDALVRDAVDRRLSARGYRLVPLDEADFHVTYYLGLDTRIDVQTVHRAFNYAAPTWKPRTQTIVREYEIGTLLIDMLDPANRALWWRGVTNAKLTGMRVEHRKQRIDAVVRQILDEFPPK